MRKSTRMMMMDGVREREDMHRREDREREYSPERDGRRSIGFQSYGGWDEPPEMRRRRDGMGRYMGDMPDYDRRYLSPRSGWPMEYDDMPRMAEGRTIRGSGSFEMMSPASYSIRGDLPMTDEMRGMGGMGMDTAMARDMDEGTARDWVRRMKNADGSMGEHFPVETTDQYRRQICPECTRWDYYAAINMIYSDYCSVAREMGCDRPDFYAHMAKSFLCDDDAKDHKMMRYAKSIAK